MTLEPIRKEFQYGEHLVILLRTTGRTFRPEESPAGSAGQQPRAAGPGEQDATGQDPGGPQTIDLHPLIEARLERMAALGQQVPLYPHVYDRTHKSLELRDRANEVIAEAREKAEAITADARRRAEEITSDARKRAEEIVADARKRAEEIQRSSPVQGLGEG